MPVSPSRIAAFDILLQVEQQGAYASELLHSTHYEKLSTADHGLVTEIVMGVLRWRSVLDEEISRFSSQKLEKLDLEVLTALRIAAYQLFALDRIPMRAAVNESVDLVKRARKGSAAPFTNAVLRKLAGAVRERGLAFTVAGSVPAELSRSSAHPLWLVERWFGQFGPVATQQICVYNQHSPQVAIHISDQAALQLEGVELAPGCLLASARRVQSGVVAGSAAQRADRIFIQDEASQLVSLLVGEGSNILDCCAAPGGKTRILAETNPSASIIAVDLHPHRARLLRKLVRAGNVQVIAADVRALPILRQFDRVLADVPCSGTGTLARHPEIKWRLKHEDLLDLQNRQLAILAAAMQHIAPGGRLLYSTCSLEREENEDVIAKALAADTSFRAVNCRHELDRLQTTGELVWKDLDSLLKGQFLRTIPGIHPCDGFFAAILEKT